MIDENYVKEVMEQYNLSSEEVYTQFWFYTNIEHCIDAINNQMKQTYLDRTDEKERFRIVRGQIDIMKNLIEESWKHRGYITKENVKLFGGRR